MVSGCVDYLTNALALTSLGEDVIHVVPGNHDVDRDLCTSRTELNHPDKFLPLVRSWHKAGLSTVLAVEGVRATEMPAAQVFSLNSCVGCQEWRLLPEEIRQELGSLLDEYAGDATDERRFSLVGERLDTPMFIHHDLEELDDRVRGVPPSQLPTVLAHHNVLPQALLRVDLYTELLNSGQFRTRLIQHNRPVVYLHGHIHEDPIEIVSDPRRPLSKLVAISAPLLINGFNVIEIHESPGGPPGLEVRPIRMQSNGVLEEAPTVRVPLIARSDYQLPLDDDLSRLISVLPRDATRMTTLRQLFNEGRPAAARLGTLRRAVLTAEWLGMLTIEGRTRLLDGCEHWVIRSTS